MLLFALGLICAGAIASVFVRFPLLVLATLLIAGATTLAAALNIIDSRDVGSMFGAFALPIVSLQVGYGVGVVASAWFDATFRSRRHGDQRRQTTPPTPSTQGQSQIDPSQGV